MYRHVQPWELRWFYGFKTFQIYISDYIEYNNFLLNSIQAAL